MSNLSTAELDALYKAAVKDQQDGRFREALKKYVSIVNAHPKLAEPYFKVGQIEFERHHYTASAAHFEKALALKPGEVTIWMHFARALRILNNRNHTRNAVKNLKKSPLNDGDKKKVNAILTAREFDKNPPFGGAPPQDVAQAANFLAKNDYNRAVEKAKSVIRKYPQSAPAYNVLGCAQMELGNYEDSEASLKKASAISSSYLEPVANMVKLYYDSGQLGKALDASRKVRLVKPDDKHALLHTALTFQAMGNIKEAIRTLENTVTVKSVDSPQSMILMSELMTSAGEHDKAVEFSKAIFVRTKSVKALLAYATALDQADRLDEALDLLEKGIEKFPNTPSIYSKYGSIKQVQGDFKEGQKYIRKAIEMAPEQGGFYVPLLKSTKVKADDPLFENMLKHFEDQNTPRQSKVSFGYAIGAAYESAKEYQKVFYYLNAANSMERDEYPYNINQRYKELERAKEYYENYEAGMYENVGESDFKPIFITGMPRSGTTLTERIISAHSTVEAGGEDGQSRAFINKVRELPGEQLKKFDTISPSTVKRIGTVTKEHFQSRFPGSNIVTDKAIGTYVELALIKAALPNAKFVLLRRDPRDNLLSIYKNSFASGTHRYANDLEDLAKYYHVYLDFIDFWREKMPGQFYELYYEKLIENPEEETRKLIDYCDLEWEDACLSFHEQESTVRTLSIYQARQPIYKSSVALWENYKEDLKPMLDILEQRGE